MPTNWKDVVSYDFHDEIDDSQLFTSELNSTKTMYEETVCDIIFVIYTLVITHESFAVYYCFGNENIRIL